MKRISLFILITLLVFSLVGCKKKEEDKVTFTTSLVTMGSDLYSSETVEGIKLISNITSFPNLEINRSQIKEVGFVYSSNKITFTEQDEYVKSLVINDNNEVVTSTLLQNNTFEYIVKVDEKDYQTNYYFRSYIIYDDKGVEKVFYSFNIDMFNAYDLALKDNSLYAKEIVEAVDGTGENPLVDPPVQTEKTILIKPNYSKTPYEFEVDGTEKDYVEVSLTSDSGYNYIFVEISGKDGYQIPNDLVLKIITKYRSEEYTTIDLDKCTKENGKLKYKYNDPCWSPLY